MKNKTCCHLTAGLNPYLCLRHYQTEAPRRAGFIKIFRYKVRIFTVYHLFSQDVIKNADTHMIVNLTLPANHPVHPCTPAKSSAHAYTQNCAHTQIIPRRCTCTRTTVYTHIQLLLPFLINDSDMTQTIRATE